MSDGGGGGGGDLAARIAEDLARQVMEVVDATGDDDLVGQVTRTLGDQSQTLEEAFIIAIRVLRAARRAEALIARARG